MVITAHVYQIYVSATPQQVWTAITDSEWTTRYFHGTAFVDPPQKGGPFRLVAGDRAAVEGEIEEMVPPADGSPWRFVETGRELPPDDEGDWHRRQAGASTSVPAAASPTSTWRTPTR